MENSEKQQQKKILQEHARNIVITQLKMVSCNKKIPNEVRPLVLKHWSTLMLNRYIRHGRDSQQWMQSVLLLKLLLKCMQPIRYPSQLKLVQNNHMALIEAVNDELYETQQDKESIKAQIATLKSHFLQMIEEYDLDLVTTSVDHHSITWWENRFGLTPKWERHLVADPFIGVVEACVGVAPEWAASYE